MKKSKLQLDDLLIDSFSTTPVRKGKGTIYGEQCTCPHGVYLSGLSHL